MKDSSEQLTSKDLNKLDERRVDRLNEAGIDEGDVISQATDNIDIWQSYFVENINRGKDDTNFALRDQWVSNERNDFIRLQKVCFTFNKVIDPINKIAGEQRKNKPDLMVRSLTGHASQEDINLRSDLVRTIAYRSQNDLIYQSAFKQALLMGYGAFQLDIDYENAKSFNKEINYLLIPDPQLACFDPTSIKPHKGDGDYCSRQYIYSEQQFNANFPYIFDPQSFIDPNLILDFQWKTRKVIVICDYYVKEYYSFKLLLLSDGSSVSEREWKEMQPNIKMQHELADSASDEVRQIIKDEIPRVVAERQSQDYDIMHYRLIKDRILDFRKWPSKYLPVIFVDGNSHYIEGRQYTKSFIHEARDAQRFVNYVGSEIATEIKNRRREQWMATPDNIKGEELNWRNPEAQQGVLIAQPDPKTGAMPQKLPQWQLSQELMLEMQRGSQDIHEILGFNEQQDMAGKDVSGKSRRERKLESSMAAYVYSDNLNQSIEQAGRVVLDLLPAVVGENERHMVLSKKDGKTQSIVLNKRNADGTVSNQIKAGDYDIEISTGPSFSVQKDMALEFFQQTIQANPGVFPLIADLWAKNLDIQYMEQVSERFKTMVPPEILAKEEGKPPPPPKPNPQDMMMQMEMKNKQSELMNRSEELNIRKKKQELEEAELIADLKKLEMNMNMDVHDRQMDMKKADLDFSAKIAKIRADLHMNKQDNATKTSNQSNY